MFLVTITLVSHCDLQSSYCIGIEYYLDVGLLNLRHLQAKTETFSAVVSALQYTDDAAFPSLTADRLQRSLDVMSETCLRAGLIINTTKKKSLVHHHLIPQHFPLVENSLKTQKIVFTWAQISFSGDITNEIQSRINLASSAFGRLSECVFGNQNLTILAKIVVYNAVIISTILYGCLTWDQYRRHIRLLDSFHISRIQLIHGLRWWHNVTHFEIRSRAGLLSIKSTLLHQNLCWISHIIRMPDSRLPHLVLYGQLRLGHSCVGGQKKCFKDHIKSMLKKCNTPFNRLEALTSDRTIW